MKLPSHQAVAVAVVDLVERWKCVDQYRKHVNAPLMDVTEALYADTWMCGSDGAVHQCWDKRGVYIITDDIGNIIYIGETASRFVPYLRTKLGLNIRARSEEEVPVCDGSYWIKHVRLLDVNNPRVAAGLACLCHGQFRVFLIPVDVKVSQSTLSERREFRALESRLLDCHEELSGYRPPLNYSGCDVATGNSLPYGSRLPRKVSDFLRRFSRRQEE